MSFNNAELERIDATLGAFLRREQPPVEVRTQLDYAYTISGRSVQLHEVRPRYNDATKKMINPFARATHAKARDVWRVYWLRADLKWHSYEPDPIVATLGDFLALVKEDKYSCFYG